MEWAAEWKRRQSDALDQMLKPLYQYVLKPLYDTFVLYAQDSPLQTLAVVCAVFILLSFYRECSASFRNTWSTGWAIALFLTFSVAVRSHVRFNAAFTHHRVGSLISYFTVDIRAIGTTISAYSDGSCWTRCKLIAIIAFMLYLQ